MSRGPSFNNKTPKTFHPSGLFWAARSSKAAAFFHRRRFGPRMFNCRVQVSDSGGSARCSGWYLTFLQAAERQPKEVKLAPECNQEQLPEQKPCQNLRSLDYRQLTVRPENKQVLAVYSTSSMQHLQVYATDSKTDQN